MSSSVRVVSFLSVSFISFAACSEPTVASPISAGVERQAVVVNGGFEADAIGAVPASWTIEKYLNDRVTPLAGGAATNNLGLLLVPPVGVSDLNLSPDAGGFNTFVVGAATVESQTDPDLGAAGSLRFPKFGTRSAVVNPGRLNVTPSDLTPTGRNRSVSSMKQTMTLAAGDIDPVDNKVHIRFVAAPVLEDPGHTNFEQPYFYIQVRNVSRNTTLYSNFNFAGQVGVAWQQLTNPAGNLTKYTNWQLIDVAPGLSAAIGEQIELIVFAAGCSRGGHWGRVYVDAFGATIPGLYLTGSAAQSSPNNVDLPYTLSYRNGSASTAAGTQVVFNTPPNTTFVSTTATGCTLPVVGTAGTITCPIGSVAAGAGGSFTIVVHINAGTTGLLTAQNYWIQATGVNPLIGSKIDTVVYTGPGTLAVVSGTPQSTAVNTAFGADMVVRVRDGANVAVPGVQVDFTVPSSGASATTPLPFGITGATGQASARPTANTVTGTYSVTASVPGIASTASFALTNTPGAPATVTVVSGTPQSAFTGAAFAAPLMVVVKDAFNNPVPGATVTFTAPGAGASATLSAAAVTNASGQTQVTATANATAGGAYSVTASVTGATSATFSLTNLSTVPASVTVVSGSPQTTVVNTAFAQPLVVVVKNAGGTVLPGVSVTFAPPASGASAALTGSTTTNASGQVSLTATANTVAGGPYNITATVGTFTATFVLTNTAGAPASVTVVSGTPQSAFTGAAFGAPLIVEVRDAFDNPIPGATVSFAAPGAGASATLTAPAVTDASGQTQVTATANAIEGGAYSVTASIGAFSAAFSLTNLSTVPASVSVVSGSPQTTVVNTAFAQPLVVVVKNTGGTALPGVNVTFAPPASGASAALSGSTTTDASGQVSLTATANTVAGGPYNVTATVGAFTATFVLTNTAGAPASVTVVSGTPQSAFTGAAYGAPLIVVVRDAFNNLVPGATVTFTAPGAGASATLTAPAVTDASGQTQVTATANATSGAYSVTASIGALSDTFSLTNLSSVPASVTVVSGSPQTTVVTTAFAQPLVVVVRNASGVAVPNATVTFTAPSTGASATFTGSTVTDAAGQVSLTATANTVAGGPYSVTATVGAFTATFVLTNTAGPAANVTVVSGSPQNAAPGTAFTASLVVLVTDAQGNPVPNADVTFTPPASGAAAVVTGTTTTDATGRVSVTATANGTAGGPYQVTAAVAGVSTPVNFSLTNDPAIAPVIVAPPQNALLTDATPDVSGTSAPNAPISVFADGSTTPACTTTADASGAWSCTVSTALTDGPHTFVATASNGTATASSPLRTVILDATAPATPVITAPTEAQVTSPSPTISGSAEPGSTVRLFLDGSSTPACTAITNAAGNYSCVIAGPLAVGAHTLTADARDAAGNTSLATPVRNFSVATGTPPGPPVISAPAAGQATNDSTPPVTGTATPGAEVRVFLDGSSTPACTTTASATGAWSCDVSPALMDGAHAAVATATTPSGTSLPSTTTPFTVDTLAPAAPVITAPAANATTSATPVYVGTSEPNLVVNVFVDGSTTAVCSTTSDAIGAWTCTSAVALSTGAHTVTASAVDRAGNQGPLTAATSFTVAAGQPPSTPVISAPLAGSVTNDGTPAFEGTATPGSTVNVFVDGSTTASCTAVADATGHFVCAPAAALSDGSHQVTATSTTTDGTSTPSPQVPFTIDSLAPGTPVITAPAANAQTNRTPTITGTAEAGSTVTVRIDGQVLCEVVATAQGQWSCPVTQPLAPGAHQVTASTIDGAGNRSMPSAPTPFTVLGMPSTPALTGPAPGSTVPTPTPTFTGLAEPGAAVTVTVDGTVVCTTTADVMGHFSCLATTPLSTGGHAVTVTATTAGGTATSTPTNFTIAPAVPTITSPARDFSTGDSTPTFSGTAEAGSSVTVKVDGQAVCTTTADGTGHFSCTPATPLSPGAHTATASATSGGGSSADSTSVPFTVLEPPVVVTPADGSSTGEFPTFTGTAQPGTTVSVRVDGTEVCQATALRDGTWSCTPTQGLTPGAHQVTAQVDDVESAPVGLNVHAYSVSGGGVGVGCTSTGSNGAWWLLPLLAFALLGRRRRALAAAVVVASTGALAQTVVPGFELERVRLNGAAAHGLLVESADLLPKFQYRAALTFHYEQDPLVLLEDGKRVGSIVGNRIGLHLSGAFSITDWLDVSLQLPIVLSQSGADLSAKGYTPVMGGVAAGTPWLGVRAAPWQQRRGDAVDVSVGLALGIPLGSAAAFTRDNTVSVIPSIGLGRNLNSFLRLGGSVGVLVRNAQPLTNSATVKDEVGSLFLPALILSTLGDGLRGEVSTRLDVPFTRAAVGAEIDLGLRYPLFDLFEVYAVGGPGFGALPGTPTFRILAGIALAPRAKPVEKAIEQPRCVQGRPHEPATCPELDLDGDGIANRDDSCPTVKGLAVRHGCPDIDSDGDGLLDADDACPVVKGVVVLKGCPVLDADEDGVLDADDACPAIRGPVALKGCPVVDADEDGVLDTVDACPTVKGVPENGGCPVVDTDEDGVPDPVDACRTVKGVKENDGCPAKQVQLVTITRDRIIIKEKVSFASGKAVILPKSFPLLEQVASILKDHPEVERVSIEGHTDSRGTRANNLKLSEARAESVRQWLLKHGIDAGRITAKGFGPDKPIGSNETDQGRELNRRVEFIIVGAETTR